MTFCDIYIILYIERKNKYRKKLYSVHFCIPEVVMKKVMSAEEYLEKILSSEPDDNCPVRKALELISGKWRTHIIYELCRHPSRRFGELKKALPKITATMLTSTLRELEAFGIVERKQFNEIPPHTEYSLTEKGKAMLPVFCELAKWSESYPEK